MFFLLRSIFWLGLAFSQMTWPQDGLAPALPAAVQAGAGIAAKVCATHPRDCVAVAATLARAR